MRAHDTEMVLNRARLYHDRRDFYIQHGDTGMREDYPGPPYWMKQNHTNDVRGANTMTTTVEQQTGLKPYVVHTVGDASETIQTPWHGAPAGHCARQGRHHQNLDG